MAKEHLMILTPVKEQAPGGWLVADGNVPIGIVTMEGQVHTPSGAGYVVCAEGPALRMGPADGAPVAEYMAVPEPHVRDAASGVTWDLRTDWVKSAAEGGPDGGHLDVAGAFAKAYTLEDAQGTVPARVKLLLAYVVVRKWMG